MGDYVDNRLFCIGLEVSVQPVPDGDDHRIPLSGVRAYKSRIPAASVGFYRGVSDASLYLSDRCVCRDVRVEPLCQKAEDGEISECLPASADDRDGDILYMEDGELLSRRSAYELL